MILSVIIVNYQVKYFLELCLFSVQKAVQGIDAEIFVVDNHSGDGSIAHLRPLFPQVQFIVNEENKGFARANNQALELAKGKYILFLNPDTVVPEDIVASCLAFSEATPRVGAVGVRMIDGSGCFLKESLRGFPSPWVAFCKLAGLTALFPRSRLFARYYLGYLPEGQPHQAPVLSGACIWVARAVLERTGGFDERFFMYAEDIDLSYRIERAGFVNYYLADVTIIHFKGESTLKDVRYVKQFYKAMSQFRRKHFSKGIPALFNAGMEVAICIRAGIGAKARAAADRQQLSPLVRSALVGDPAVVQQLKEALGVLGKRAVVDQPQQAEEIIICQGESYSFGACIRGLEAIWRHGADRPRVLFHAAGSGSAAGSADKDGQGEVLVL